jgi:hypothetical protein
MHRALRGLAGAGCGLVVLGLAAPSGRRRLVRRKPRAMASNINGSAFFAFLGGSVIGFNAAYPSLGHVSDLTPAGRAALAQLDTMCQEQALVTYAGKRIQVAARYFGEWVAPRIFDGELEEERLRRRY